MHCRVCDKEKCRNMKIHCQETWHYNCLSVNCTTYCTILRHKVDDLGFRLYEKCMFFRPNTHKGYKNRYDIFDHGHKKLLLCIFSKTYKLWCIEGVLYWCKYFFLTFLGKWCHKIETIFKSP